MIKSFNLGKQVIRTCTISSSSCRFYSPQSKTTKGVLHVNLVDEKGKFMFSGTIDEVKRYAKKHDLHLVNYENKPHSSTKNLEMQALTRKKIVETEDETNDSEAKKKSKKNKELKRVMLNDNTGDHDLDIKINRMAYFLYKGFKIRLVINGTKADGKMAILDRIKKRFVPHLSFKQVNVNPTAIKLLIFPEKTWPEYYEENLKKKNEDTNLDEDDGEEEEDLIDMNEVDELINKKLK